MATRGAINLRLDFISEPCHTGANKIAKLKHGNNFETFTLVLLFVWNLKWIVKISVNVWFLAILCLFSTHSNTELLNASGTAASI